MQIYYANLPKGRENWQLPVLHDNYEMGLMLCSRS